MRIGADGRQAPAGQREAVLDVVLGEPCRGGGVQGVSDGHRIVQPLALGDGLADALRRFGEAAVGEGGHRRPRGQPGTPHLGGARVLTGFGGDAERLGLPAGAAQRVAQEPGRLGPAPGIHGAGHDLACDPLHLLITAE